MKGTLYIERLSDKSFYFVFYDNNDNFISETSTNCYTKKDLKEELKGLKDWEIVLR